MASLQKRNGSFRVMFCHHGKLHTFTLGQVEESEALAKASQVDYLLMRLKQGLISVPIGIDIVTFVQFDGKPPQAANDNPARRQVTTLGKLRQRYLETHSNGTIESNTLDTCRLHLNHLCRYFGEAVPLSELTLSRLQDYVNMRVGDKVSPATIRKEIATTRAAWNWGGPMNLTSGPFPSKGLRYPKADEKPPFMTMTEVERHIAAGGDPAMLWECLFLQPHEITEMLTHVRKNALHDWIYPMFCFAAYTGARRSEIIRAQVLDVDLNNATVLIREKKRSQSQRTTRRVPLTVLLKQVLQDWLKIHPGGNALFCHTERVARSKKRSHTTGHQCGKSRAKTLVGRLATVRKRDQAPKGSLTRNELHDHLKRTLADSKWKVLRGLHVLRHSFISTCASRAIDQRLIDHWSGHSTEEQRRRYRHLFPDLQQEAISRAFAS